jgi:hypothetical protein
MLRLAAVPLLVCAFFASGCFGDSNSIASTNSPTLLTADPLTFRGKVRCGAPELEKYVVTPTDVSTSPPTHLPSSGPTTCTELVSFETPCTACPDPKLVIGHFYTATIDGYDRNDIVPLEPGSNVMIDPSTGAPVCPRWRTTCGDASRALDGSPDVESIDDAETSADALDGSGGSSGYNALRPPTQVLASVEVVFQGCLSFQSPAAVDTCMGDANEEADTAGTPADGAAPDSP